jgi:hypothetical protein
MLYSIAATWRSAGRWFYQLRVNRTEAKHDFDSVVVLLGAGYRLDQDGSFLGNAGGGGWRDRRDEIVVSGGKTIVNSFESEGATAKAIEYRHAFTPVVRGSLAWVNEGDARLVRRDGFVAQAWLEPGFSNNRFTLGLGIGGYYAIDEHHHDTRKLHGILTTTASYRFGPRWVGRLSWHRIVSTYDRDSDIILVGLGYRF